MLMGNIMVMIFLLLMLYTAGQPSPSN